MYEKDKRQRITLRLTEEQFAFISSQTDMLGITPSDYLRMLVNSVLFAAKSAVDQKTFANGIKEVLGRENDKTDKHD